MQSKDCWRNDSEGCGVRLIEPARRVPQTAMESLVVSLLKQQRKMPLDKLVCRLADNLYRGELRGGAWAIDIGLFGSSLFVADALRELEGSKDDLWELCKL